MPLISCDYVFLTDSRDDEERQLTEAEAIAVGATPILVIRDKRSKMIHADDCMRCKGIEDEFPKETTTKWILGLGYPEVIIRTHVESSIVALSRRVGEKLNEAGVKTMHNTSAQHTTADQQDMQRVVSEMRKRKFARWYVLHELHGETAGKNPREKPHRQQSVNSCQDEFITGDQWIWRGTGAENMRAVKCLLTSTA